MIVDLVRKFEKDIADYEILSRRVTQADDIETTAAKLDTLYQELKNWHVSFKTIEPYLDVNSQGGLRVYASKLSRQIEESRDLFETEFNQNEKLKSALETFDRLKKDTLRSWLVFAQSRVNPLRDLAEFARRLPRMQGQMGAIDGLLQSVSSSMQRLPARREDVKTFLEELRTLDSKLANIKGLGVEQRDFLNKVRIGTATLEDITGPLLEWCKEENLAAKIKVSL